MASRPTFALYLAALTLFAAAGTIAACDGGDCTDMGCEDTVSVTIEKLPLGEVDRLPITIEICDGPTCATTTITPDGPDGGDRPNGTTCVPFEDLRCCSPSPTWAPCRITSKTLTTTVGPDPSRMRGIRSIHVVIKAGDGSVLLDASPMVTPRVFYPNGPECGSPCYGAKALLTVGGS
jgi:hypothetical protein